MENSYQTVVKNPGFLNLWVNQILVQLSYNSLNFALIIWVFRLTNSNTAVSALLFAVYLPAVIFGLFAGIVVDVTDRRKIIMAINFLLAVCFLSLIFLKFNFLAILLITFLVNTLAQFYMPTESSAIPLIVKRSQLLAANSLFSTTLYASFLIGFGLAGPLIHLLGIDTLFGLGVMMLSIAFVLSFGFPSIINKSDPQGKQLIKALSKKNYQTTIPLLGLEVKKVLNQVKGKLPVSSSILILALVQVVIGVLAVLVPAFLEKALQINATDASYVLVIPLGLGMILGGFIIGKIGHFFPKRRIVGTGILIAGLLFFLVGISPLITPVVRHFRRPRPLPFFYQLPRSAILVAGSFLLGITMVSIIIPSQTVLQENTPEEDRGKIFSLLGVAMAGLSLLPVLLTGILSDIFGSMPIFIAMGGSIALIGLLALKPAFFFEKHHLPFKVREFLGLGHWEKE